VDSDVLQKERPNNAINMMNISRTLLRIVARLPKNEYTEVSSIENERQDEVLIHNDLSDPASEESTTQGLDVL
jgi:hypothetical protein